MKKYMVRLLILICAALLTPVVMPGQAQAADKESNQFKEAEKNDLEYSGSITAIDTNAPSVTVKHKTKGPMTFTLASGCMMFVKHKTGAATLADFKVGEEVNVLYKQNGTSLICDSLYQPGAHAREKERKAQKESTTP